MVEKAAVERVEITCEKRWGCEERTAEADQRGESGMLGKVDLRGSGCVAMCKSSQKPSWSAREVR